MFWRNVVRHLDDWIRFRLVLKHDLQHPPQPNRCREAGGCMLPGNVGTNLWSYFHKQKSTISFLLHSTTLGPECVHKHSHLFECVHTRTRVSGCSRSCLMAWANVYVLPVPNGPRQKGRNKNIYIMYCKNMSRPNFGKLFKLKDFKNIT
jgi:hypothetical protein